jgi:Dolichyl-phosphate-mannose-protein mannosyltransferase
MRHGRRDSKRWWTWIGVWTVVALGIRLASVFGRPHTTAKGDAYFYHNTARLLIEGHGFISPLPYLAHHETLQTASFPPLFVWVVAVPIAVGFKSFFAERIWCCIIGAAAVVVCGMAGREIGGQRFGHRVGLIAAFLLAVYPNIWMSDELAMSETLSPLLIAAVLLFAYRFWRRPSLRAGIWLGVVLGVAFLGRDELAPLVVLLLLPLVLLARTLSWRQRAGVLGAAVGAIILVTGPWIGYNMSRFKDATFISTGLGVTMASADCNATFYGRFEGYWSATCAIDSYNRLHLTNKEDESVQSAKLEHASLTYLRHHESRLVPVTLAKLGRGFEFFHPEDQIKIDAYIETRPYHWAEVGLGMYYAMWVLSIGGTVLLRRRKVPSFPLWVVGLNVVISMVVTFGDPRYRTTFEVSLVLLSSVQLEWIWSKLRRSPTRDAPGSGYPIPGPEPDPSSGDDPSPEEHELASADMA